MYLSSVPNSTARRVLCLKQPLELDLCALEGAPSTGCPGCSGTAPQRGQAANPGSTGGVPRVGDGLGGHLGAPSTGCPVLPSLSVPCLLNENLLYCLWQGLDQLCLFMRCLEIPGRFLQYHKRFAVDASRKQSSFFKKINYNKGF